MTSDLASMRQSVQRANVEHYRKILRTYLTDEERSFVERRIAEEEAAFQKAAAVSATIGLSVGVP